VTARRHPQHPGEVPVDAGKHAPVAEKAAAIDAAQARPLTRKTVVKRVLVVAVAGAAIYLVLPALIAALGAWPRLSTLNPVWFTVAIAAELISFTCNFALQRLALRTRGWFAVVTAGLAGNAVTNSLPGREGSISGGDRTLVPTWPEPGGETVVPAGERPAARPARAMHERMPSSARWAVVPCLGRADVREEVSCLLLQAPGCPVARHSRQRPEARRRREG